MLQAFDTDHLAELLDSNSSAPDWTSGAAERIADYAEERAATRGEESALDADGRVCLITTDWSGFTDDWGFDDGNANQVALGTKNPTAGDQADLFEDTVILQTGWLRTGDGRKKQAEPYQDEDFEDADEGDMWIPHAAMDYICIVELDSELIHGEVELAEAM